MTEDLSLFAPLPVAIAANIRQGHEQRKGFRGMRHDAATARAFYVLADETPSRFKPASEEEAATLWALLDQRRVTQTTAMQVYRKVTSEMSPTCSGAKTGRK